MSCICHFFKVLARRAGLLTTVLPPPFSWGLLPVKLQLARRNRAYPLRKWGGNHRYSHFPIPLNQYKPAPPDASLSQVLTERNKQSGGFNLAVTLVFLGGYYPYVPGRAV